MGPFFQFLSKKIGSDLLLESIFFVIMKMTKILNDEF